MLKRIKNLPLEHITNFLFCLFPISFILGNSIVHLNLYAFLILSILYIKEENYKINFSLSNKILICFFILIIISSIMNYFLAELKELNKFQMIKYSRTFNSILLFRFVILYLVIETLLIKNKLSLKKFFITCFLCTSIVSFDIIVQYIFGYNLLGYKIDINTGNITGMFENEAIAGSYIQKFSLLSIFGSLFLFRKKNKKPILFIIILLLLFGVFFASNRMNAIILFFSLLLLLLLDKKIRLVVAASLIIFTSVAAILMSNDKILKKQYHQLFYRFTEGSDNVNTDTKGVEKNSKIKTLYKKINLHNSDHFSIYLTAIESWKNKPIFGGGHKSFRNNCKHIINEASKGGKKTFKPICSSHPHNYQIEVLHNTGIIGFILIVFFIFILLLKIFKKLINIKSGNKTYSMYIMPIAITMFAEIWPLKTTGSLFATWNGTAVWLIIGLSAIATTNFSEKKLDKPIKNQSSFIFKILTILFTSLIIKRLFFV